MFNALAQQLIDLWLINAFLIYSVLVQPCTCSSCFSRRVYIHMCCVRLTCSQHLCLFVMSARAEWSSTKTTVPSAFLSCTREIALVSHLPRIRVVGVSITIAVVRWRSTQSRHDGHRFGRRRFLHPRSGVLFVVILTLISTKQTGRM